MSVKSDAVVHCLIRERNETRTMPHEKQKGREKKTARRFDFSDVS